jgi:hypothetical protein
MKFDFTSHSFPDLSHLSPAERRRLLRRCASLTFRDWPTWAALFACGIWAAIGAYLGRTLITGSWNGLMIGAILGASVGGAVLGLVKGILVRSSPRAEPASPSINATQSE